MTKVDAQSWTRDRQRFVDDARAAARQGTQPSRDHGNPLGPLGRQFATLTSALLDAETVEDVLTQVVHATSQVFPQAEIVSVTLRSSDGRHHTPVSTSSVARTLDDLQYEFGEGPCVTAADDPGPAYAYWRDLGGDGSPWPRFAEAAHKIGVRSVLAVSLVPTPVPPRLSGAMNLYSPRVGGLDDVDRDVLLLIATHASLALASTEAVTRAKLHDAQLKRAIDSRDVIGQAKGILMGRRGVSAEEAFDILRESSQNLNVKLVQIAEILAAQPNVLD